MSEHDLAVRPLPNKDEIAALPPDGGPEFNRLIHEKNPYLLQHARNPVDWFPWGQEAFAKAQREDKPVFLSIGYSTCHWCHVMERESFENEDIADILNRYYVCIKVDREERPDIDEIYMNATQLITSRGGWPNSLWLLPDRRPWYAGTYFPPEDISGRPGFGTILVRLAEFWRTKREAVEDQANKLVEAMNQISSGQQVDAMGQPTRDLVRQALRELERSFDRNLGGFGNAPKFPPHGSLNLIIYEHGRKPDASSLEMATRTLDAMAQGGMRDHIGGGFHRYSTDARWLLPHFEKMLYDNAQLARAYTSAYLITGDETYRDIAVEAYEWVLREMTHQGGGFYSALDADSEGEDGRFYLWSRGEIIAILGEEEGALFCRVYNIEKDGNFREESTGKMTGTNIPHLNGDVNDIAKSEGIPLEDLLSRLAESRNKLLKQRNRRVWPHLDDKVLTSWNGLMIGSFAFAGKHLDEPRYTAAAERAADFILSTMRKDGRLLRTFRDDEAKLNAYLDDYAFLADGLLELYEMTGDTRWLEETKALMDTVIEHYWDERDGGFYFISKDHEDLLIRSKDPTDKAIPSGNGVAARVLIRLGSLTGEERYVKIAKTTLDAFLGVMQRAPRATESLILAVATYFDEISSQGVAGGAEAEVSGIDTGADDYAIEGPVSAQVFVSHLQVAPGEVFDVAVKLKIDEGWHINSNDPIQEYLKPTTIGLEDDSAVSVGDVSYPVGKEVTLPFSSAPLSVYEDDVWIRVPVTVRKDAAEGPAPLKFRIRVQPCNDRSCHAPATITLSVPVEVRTNAIGGETRHKGIFESLGISATGTAGQTSQGKHGSSG